MTQRMEIIKNNLHLKDAEGLLIFKPVNLKYYAGFTGSEGYIFANGDRNVFLTDFRYAEQAKSQCAAFELVEISRDFSVYDFLSNQGLKRLYVEESHATLAFHDKLRERAKNTVLIGLDGIVGEQRIIKDKSEIEKIACAAKIADKAFHHILGVIKPGLSEKAVALELEFFMRRKGAEGLSFESIVASGARSSMPHGAASEKIIEPGEFVTLDFGCKYEGYCSDMTRTIHMGKANPDEKQVYNLVLEAQIKALQSIREGASGVSVDKCARDIIMGKGYGDFFGHGLGHGVGLEIHEEPRLSPDSKTILKAGMVVTDEPGIYLPGRYGVRIEDLLAVRKDGCEVLSASPKELIEI